MKFNGYSFPHPVLGLNDDIEGSVHVEEVSYDDATDADNFTININYALDNTDLLSFLINKRVKFLCEASCTATMFRQAFLCSDTKQVIQISKNSVRERVDLIFLMVACENIPNYRNAKAHPDFREFGFDIDEGDVLAFLGESQFIAEINYQKLKAVSSFLEVVKGENETGDFNIILDNPKIQIQLSHNDFRIFSTPAVGKNVNYASTFHSALVLPALIHALYQLKVVPGNDDLAEKSWAKIIEFRMENDVELKSIQLGADTVLKAAQIILGMPVERLLGDLLGQLTEKKDENE